MQALKLHWASSKANFGDWLSPAICRAVSGRPVEYAEANRCDLIAIGSILGRVQEGWFPRRTNVWGSGFIDEQRPVRAVHDYHAVRGHKTAALIRKAEIKAFGDPGLLADLLLPDFNSVPKQHRLGVIPHYKDRGHPAVLAFAERHPGTKVLDVFTDLPVILREIASCEMVLSSSLHGLIVSDAFRIPNAWIEISGDLRGGTFKFLDYYSIFPMAAPAPMRLDRDVSDAVMERTRGEYQRAGLGDVQRALIESFPFKSSENERQGIIH